MLDRPICDKARFSSCRVVDTRTLHDFLVVACLVVSRCVMCGGHNSGHYIFSEMKQESTLIITIYYIFYKG